MSIEATEPVKSIDLVDVCALIRAACDAEGSQRAWANRHGFTSAFVSAVLNATSAPSPHLLAVIGLRRVTRYVPLRTRSA